MAIVLGLPDILIIFLVGTGIIPSLGWGFIWPHVWLGTFWYLLLMFLAAKEVERLSWGESLLLALVGFVVNSVVQFIFIR